MTWTLGTITRKSEMHDRMTTVDIDIGAHTGKVQVHGEDAKAIAKEIVQLLNRTRPKQSAGFE